MTTIFIVDDEPLLRHTIRHYLESDGFTVVEAANGLEALEKLPNVRPGLILLDVMMPGLSGL
ncbi:MAG: response regulator, partial [Candidatus Methylomirabilales bacterium]